MRILFDENLGQSTVVRLLREKGHQVRPINKTALRGILDDRVVEIAFEENFVIITLDKDVKAFYDQHNLVPFGLIFFRERNARGVKTKGKLAKYRRTQVSSELLLEILSSF